jgi:aminoglycoside phosphotransferase (APT) family kinase protein
VSSAEQPALDAAQLASLANWMDARGLGSGPVTGVVRLTGGTQNILLRFARGEREYVLRRPPAVPRPTSAQTILREARVVGALSHTSVPHARLIAICEDEVVLGAVFYLMEPVDGFNPTVAMPEAAACSPDVRWRMGIELIDALAALAEVDIAAADLQDFGRLDGFIERQVGRWASELASYARFEAWDGHRDLGDVEVIGAWLERHRPSETQAGVIHGDYHIGNVIYGLDGELKAVVDWEMATLGDPLVDLGRLLVSWPMPGGRRPFTMRVEPLGGFPPRDALVARYAERSGRSLDALPWFEVLACYKLGIILEGTHARAQAGQADTVTGQRLHASAAALLQLGRDIVAGC